VDVDIIWTNQTNRELASAEMCMKCSHTCDCHRNLITAYANIFPVLLERKECIGYIGSFEVILTNQSYGRERGIG